MSPLAVAWYFIVALLLAIYSVLDGFDLGAGFWSLFSCDEDERDGYISAIAPFWDGNEVWLLTGGGAIFAAFPEAYATIFSGFYLALILVVIALAFRAVSIEFRAKHDSAVWRRGWGIAFGVASALPPILFGVAVGNILMGLPLDSARDYTGTFLDLLKPLPLLSGVAVLALFAGQGAAFLRLRADGRAFSLAPFRSSAAGIISALLLAVFFAAAAGARPGLMLNLSAHGALFMLPAAAVLFSLIAAFASRAGLSRGALAAQSVSIVSSIATAAAALFPNVVPSDGAGVGLTIGNASSSPMTLEAMLIIACIGMPLVIVYHVWIYRAFGSRRAIGAQSQ